MIPAPCRIDPESRNTGYPGEKPDGEMWTSGKCEDDEGVGAWRHEEPCGSSNLIFHKCDTSGGHSGSPVYDRRGNVFGVHSGGSRFRNAAYAFTSTSFLFTQTWG